AEVEKKLAVNLPYKATVTLHKYDADEEGQKAAIPGTEFTLYKDSVSKANIYKKVNTTGIFTTDQNGDLSIEIHEKGTYILKETKAAAGYQTDANNSFTFTLADNASSTSYGYGTTTSLEKDENGVANKRLTGKLTLTKTDAGTNEPLKDVVYTLKRTDVPKDAEGNALSDYLLKDSVEVRTGHNYEAVKQTDDSGQQISGKWTIQETGTNTEGKISITGLNWGTYVLTEKTELSGYKLEKDSDGNATNTHTYIIDGKTNQLSASHEETNAKNSVVLNKTSITDAALGLNNKPLAGAEFEIHEGNDCGGEHTGCTKVNFYTSATDKNSQTDKVTTDSDGNVVIYGLPTDTSSETAKKTYHLVEVKAPKGYILQTTPATFTIDRQGIVEIRKKSGNAEGTSVVSMQDEPIRIYVKKLGESGTDGLTGATFTLKDTCPKDESGKDTCETNHKLANGSESETLQVNSTDGILIPIERVIGGHTYTLTETKAPDGYEATAVVTFKVKTDGTIDEGSMTASGGYISNTQEHCAALDNNKTIISIRDEKVRMTLTKVDDADQTKKLKGVKFTLTPYSRADGTESSFTAGFNLAGYSNITYDAAKDIYTLTTNDSGKIVFPDGLLKHDNSYLLRETASISGYYLSKEAKAGVILDVDSAGKVSIRRLTGFSGTITKEEATVSSCPVTLNPEEGNTGSDLIAKNMQSTAFNLTKSVSGNMGDYNGSFAIKLEVYEPDGTKVGEKEITLKNGGKYSSKDGLAGLSGEAAKAFGTDAIPVGSTLVITENNELNYTAVVKVKQQDGSEKEITHEPSNKGQVKVTLDRVGTIEIELTNKKDVSIDVGVNTENQTPLAVAALLIPVLWLAGRYRRKRRGGEN
ncbi:MAG: SpaA isopeptide-forming pilin-related protein, partial [Coprococcus sp.]|nr:SpaA isopeptide-forming pilin-related protein [Coprococcus sp.]